MFRVPLVSLFVGLFAAAAWGDEPVDFARDVQPLLAKYCVDCHGPKKQKAGLRLDSAAALLKGSDSGAVVVPGKAAGSLVVQALTGAKDVSEMPPEGRPR